MRRARQAQMSENPFLIRPVTHSRRREGERILHTSIHIKFYTQSYIIIVRAIDLFTRSYDPLVRIVAHWTERIRTEYRLPTIFHVN